MVGAKLVPYSVPMTSEKQLLSQTRRRGRSESLTDPTTITIDHSRKVSIASVGWGRWLGQHLIRPFSATTSAQLQHRSLVKAEVQVDVVIISCG